MALCHHVWRWNIPFGEFRRSPCIRLRNSYEYQIDATLLMPHSVGYLSSPVGFTPPLAVLCHRHILASCPKLLLLFHALKSTRHLKKKWPVRLENESITLRCWDGFSLPKSVSVPFYSYCVYSPPHWLDRELYFWSNDGMIWIWYWWFV